MNFMSGIATRRTERPAKKTRREESVCENCARYKGWHIDATVTSCSEYAAQKIRKYRIRHEDGTEEEITELIPVEACIWRGENR